MFEAGMTHAQVVPLVVRGQPSCRSCSLQVTAGAVVGDTSGGPGELNGNIRNVVIDRQGHVFVSVFALNELVAQYDRQGTFVRRVGRIGAGPGEYRHPWPIGVSGDSLLILDPGNSRLTFHSIASNQSLASAPMILLSRSDDVTRTRDGSLVGNVALETPAEAGLPLHRFSAGGTKVRSFGAKIPSLRPDLRFASMRLLTPGADGGIWASHITSYEMEYYDRSDALTRIVRRDFDRFPPGTGRMVTAQPDGEPPQPKILGIQEDEAGRIWILALIPDERWKEAFGRQRLPPRRPGAPQYYGVDDVNRLYDTMIDVLDPEQGKLIASHRVDDALSGFAGRLVAWSSVVGNASGIMQAKLWQLSLREP